MNPSLSKKSLLKSSPISKISTILKIYPFFGPNGLLRARGRTHLLEVASFRIKHLVILDARNPLVRTFLQHLHERHCHHGVEYLRALTQQNFAILKLRAMLKSIQSKCVKSGNEKRKLSHQLWLTSHEKDKFLDLLLSPTPGSITLDLSMFQLYVKRKNGGDFFSLALRLAPSTSK